MKKKSSYKVKRKISLFNVIVTIFFSSAIIVFFVYNIIMVNSLAVENDSLKTELNQTVTVNNKLQTEIEKLSSLDNIKSVAEDKLDLNCSTYGGLSPKKLTINKSELDELIK